MTANVALLFAEQAMAAPDRIALVFPDGRQPDGSPKWEHWTYQQLERNSNAYANGFTAKGLRRGDRVLFLVKPSLNFYALLLGLLKIGAIPVVVDPGMGLKNVLACIAQIQPRIVIALPLVHAVRTFVRKPFLTAEVFITAGRRWFWGGSSDAECRGAETPFPSGVFNEAEEAFIVFTSGSTGLPKGVSFCHGMFAGATRVMQQQLGLAPGLVSLETFAPFVLFHLASGETVIIPDMNLTKPATADPKKLIEAIHAWKPRTLFASPIVLGKVIDECEQTHQTLPGLHQILTGVAPVPGELHARFLKILDPGSQLIVNYGATEALTVSFIQSSEILDSTWSLTKQGAGTCVGLPYPEIDIRLIQITDNPISTWNDSLLIPDGEIGEIVVGGPVTSPEYKDLPDANAKAKIQDGSHILHRMGDLGYRDAQGRLWFCGRKAHRIETANGVIPNTPLEGVLNEHPAVRRSAVVGIGPKGQQEAVAWIELNKGFVWSSALEREILAKADVTRWAGVLRRIKAHPSFPLDARHQAKIRNELLQQEAERAFKSV